MKTLNEQQKGSLLAFVAVPEIQTVSDDTGLSTPCNLHYPKAKLLFPPLILKVFPIY